MKSLPFLGVLALGTVGLCAPVQVQEKDLIGTWHNVSNFGVEEVTFAADHKYHATHQGAGPGTVDGTWQLQGNVLVHNVTAGTAKTLFGAAIRGEFRETIVDIDADGFTTQTGVGTPYYRRGAYDVHFNLGALQTTADVEQASAKSTQLVIGALPLEAYAAMAKFREVTQIRYLTVNGSSADDQKLAALGKLGLPKLRTIILNDSPKVTDASLGDLAALPALDGLAMRNTGITDAGCEVIAKKLKLDGISVDDSPGVRLRGLTALVQSPNLREVSFSLGGMVQADLLKLMEESRNLKRMTVAFDKKAGVRLDFPALREAAKAKNIQLFKTQKNTVSRL